MIHPEARFPSIERRYDPPDEVDVYGVATTVTVRIPTLPDTGFAPNRITRLPSQPPAKQYQLLSELRLQIPALHLDRPIVGIPYVDEGWDLTWLWDQAGYLEKTAFPSWSGNAALTAHVVLPSSLPGPFANLSEEPRSKLRASSKEKAKMGAAAPKPPHAIHPHSKLWGILAFSHELRWGDQVILRAFGQRYVYEVREVRSVSPWESTVLKNESYDWLTLITCRDFDETQEQYHQRMIVRAVLIRVEGW